MKEAINITGEKKFEKRERNIHFLMKFELNGLRGRLL